MANYRPQCFLRTADVTVGLTFPEGAPDPNRMVRSVILCLRMALMILQIMPGDNVEMVCEIHKPIAIEQGQRFNIREGGRTVATGLVTRIIE